LADRESISYSRPATATAASYLKESQLTKNSLDYTEEDEAGYGDDDLQQDNETATEGARFVKQKHGRTVDHVTVAAEPHDANVLPLSDPEHFEEDDDKDPTASRHRQDREAAD
jgi:hypothetical protein